jgi:hypothetical protein
LRWEGQTVLTKENFTFLKKLNTLRKRNDA